MTALLTMDKQRLQEGISEDEAWRLFQQVVDALVYMSSLGIVSAILSSRYLADW